MRIMHPRDGRNIDQPADPAPTLRAEKLAHTVREAADATGTSVSTVLRGIRATDPAAFPPPLVGVKRKGSGEKAEYLIPKASLEAWVASFPDA